MLDAIALPRERRPVRSYAKPAADPSLAAIRQLEAGGLDPRDVRHIVQTHLDLDYVGGLADYPWATVHVHESELDAALARRDVKGRGRYRPAMWAHGPRWEVYSEEGEAWRGFVAVRELKGLPSEILPVPLFGHRAATAELRSNRLKAGCLTPGMHSSIPERCTALDVSALPGSDCSKMWSPPTDLNVWRTSNAFVHSSLRILR